MYQYFRETPLIEENIKLNTRASACPHCGGKMMLRSEEIICLMCGMTNYLPIQTLAAIPRPEYREELITSLDKTSFKIKYRIVNRALLSRLPEKGSGTIQPYASCVNISGPTRTLTSAQSRENLKKGFYRTTGLRLKDLEEAFLS
jgi:hypothetical protein